MKPYCNPTTPVDIDDYVVTWTPKAVKVLKATKKVTIVNRDCFVAFAYKDPLAAANKKKQLEGEIPVVAYDRRNGYGVARLKQYQFDHRVAQA